MGAAEDRPDEKNVTRREILRRAGLLGSGALVGDAMLAWHASPSWARLIERAAVSPAIGTTYQDIDHFVFLMMENRSYDHYFGAYHKGRGFGDHPKNSLGAFAQEFPTQAANQPVGGNKVIPKNTLLPFHLDSRAGFECTDDLSHDWGPMHDCWNGGKDGPVGEDVHTYLEGKRGPTTMGYYTGADIPFYWALADNFTLCDAYHCSIMGPTHPNRIMQLSGTIDPQGGQGGPVVQTVGISESGANEPSDWNLQWETMPEVLQDAGVSWKVYSPSNGSDVPTTGIWPSLGLENYGTWTNSTYTPDGNPDILAMTDNVLPYFGNFQDDTSPLYQNAFGQTFPGQFVTDVNAGTLPSVSWVIPPLGFDEHPAAPRHATVSGSPHWCWRRWSPTPRSGPRPRSS